MPATILPEAATLPTPTGLTATAGDGQVTFSWDAPASGSGVTHHEYRFKTDGSYGGWTTIANSAPGETNAAGFTVTGLTNGTAHTFQLHAADADGNSAEATAMPVTPSATVTPPTIDSVAVTSTPILEPDTYGEDETIEISVTFNDAVRRSTRARRTWASTACGSRAAR